MGNIPENTGRSFFARFALLLLCMIFFLTPFALRGARMGLEGMKNNVKDWLPSDFPETVDLEWFGRHFIGEQFVVVTWPGCTASDPRFIELVAAVKKEIGAGGSAAEIAASVPPDNVPEEFADLPPDQRRRLERMRAREIGADLGLSIYHDVHHDWGNRQEKWLRGDGNQWYFITPNGELYRWTGKSNIGGLLLRAVTRLAYGPQPVAGDLITTIGEPPAPERPNEFHENPRLVTARLFKSIVTGPNTLAQLSEKNGPLWPRGVDDQFAAEEARDKALHRLTGSLFGPDGKQTCMILTLSEAGKRDLRRVIGRPLAGRPQGRLLELAEDCGIGADELKMGGPPVDNVAIDEEGQITIFRLIGYSMFVGISLAFICFRSFKVTIMIFFVGGVSAITSLAIVWWTGESVDAILMSMPPLVYVLGLSGAVHITNYYRDAVEDHGLLRAPERALAHGWKPCTLAAFTTALGLLSLNTSNLVPIRKFGFYSAVGVMATLIILFTYLPSAIQLWPPGYHKKNSKGQPKRSMGLQKVLTNFWEPVGTWITGHWALVTVASLIVFAIGVMGLPKIRTTVQLINLFDNDAKIIRDYQWLEEHLGKLVPMELVVRVDPAHMQPTKAELEEARSEDAPRTAQRLQLSFLERMELTSTIQQAVEQQFGDDADGIVGRGMSATTFAPELPPPGLASITNPERWGMNGNLEKHRDEYLATDYLKIDSDPAHRGSELWRISLRLGALKKVDYGYFVSELKRVVEPVLTAYGYRDEILRAIDESRDGGGFVKAKVAFLGIPDPEDRAAWDGGHAASDATNGPEADPKSERVRHDIDQTYLFASTIRDLMSNAGVNPGGIASRCWHNPETSESGEEFYTSEQWGKILSEAFDAVVLVRDHPNYDLGFIREHADIFIDARDHQFDPTTPTQQTAVDRDAPIHVVYTGLVPIVFKAQSALLRSLIDSIGWAFVMIAMVMMFLLRSGPYGIFNLLNVRGGMISMIPNVFPVALIFGFMGHGGIKVDIGTMMTASVAMGVAVDDTIHFLTWFRDGIAQGMDRRQAILEAYRRCAPAMTQTTLIGGLGLAVFAFSTFTPTQCFGVMMLTLLLAALVGDLIFLPALLAGPLGRYFCPKVDPTQKSDGNPPDSDQAANSTENSDRSDSVESPMSAPHIQARKHSGEPTKFFRWDQGHGRATN